MRCFNVSAFQSPSLLLPSLLSAILLHSWRHYQIIPQDTLPSFPWYHTRLFYDPQQGKGIKERASQRSDEHGTRLGELQWLYIHPASRPRNVPGGVRPRRVQLTTTMVENRGSYCRSFSAHLLCASQSCQALSDEKKEIKKKGSQLWLGWYHEVFAQGLSTRAEPPRTVAEFAMRAAYQTERGCLICWSCCDLETYKLKL